MRMRTFLIIVFLAGFALPATAQRKLPRNGMIKYISIEAVYVNLGIDAGLIVGDSLSVIRKNRVIARLAVKHIASKSAACTVLWKKLDVKRGDVVIGWGSGPVAKAEATGAARNSSTTRRATKKRPLRRRRAPRHNLTTGYFALANYFQKDLTGANYSSSQPSISGKLTVRRLFGSGVAFRLRHRSRLYSRSRAASTGRPKTEWSHHLFEFALVYDDDEAPVNLGLGRVLSPHIRGVGYIDGAHFAVRVHPNWRIGLAAGAEPENAGTSVQTLRKKYGAFLAYESGTFERARVAVSVALSGTYDHNRISREFVYLQNNLWISRAFSLYQSVEVDVNRAWRQAAVGKKLSFSNFYLSSNVTISPAIALYFSYDARRNVRTYSNISTPDSLFDDSTLQGLSGGLSLQLPWRMHLRANAGMRFRERGLQDNTFASFYYGIRQFPWRGHSMSARLSVFNTEFTRGYRPLLTYRFPINYRVTLNMTGGGYIYKTGTRTTSSYFAEINTYLNLTRRYYAALNYRQYFDRQLQSLQLYGELGMSF